MLRPLCYIGSLVRAPRRKALRENLKSFKVTFLLIVVLGSMITVPLVSCADERIDNVSTNRAIRFQRSNSKKVKIIAKQKDKEKIKDVFKKICATKTGKELVRKITEPLEIKVENLYGTNVLYCTKGIDSTQITIDSNLLGCGKNRELEKILRQELEHFVHDIDGKFDEVGFKRVLANVTIEAPDSEKEMIEKALQVIYTTKIGRRLLQRMPAGLEISYDSEKEYEASYGCKRISIGSAYFRSVRYLALGLGHEIRHSVQDVEGRMNKGNGQDGIEGFSDFVIGKLCEVETSLFEAIELNGRLDEYPRTATLSVGKFYEELNSKFKDQGYDSATASRLARTEYVKTLWESTPKETSGAEYFMPWSKLYNGQAFNFTVGSPIGKKDVDIEYEIIQKYISEMDIDLTPEYFMAIENTHIPADQLAFYQERDKQARAIKGSKLKLNKKTDLNSRKKRGCCEDATKRRLRD